jgi:Cu/Ag efflux protein CusF
MKHTPIVAAALIAFSAGTFAQVANISTVGEIRKVDKEAGKLTIRHEALENLGMPAMTMVFRVADPKFLDAVKEGDKVSFVADKVNGQFTVMNIKPAK